MTSTVTSSALPAQRLRDALNDAARGLVERESLLELIALAAVAREHVLVIGPPGTAKSEAVRRVARALGLRAEDGHYFEYLLGRFTEPSEIFGPVDLRRLREGVVETSTRGMLPEAEIAFLDEVFLGSSAILNTLLSILNERRFRRGHSVVDCPLRVAVGASNALPDDDNLAAFADRFLVRVFIEPVPDPMLEELLTEGWRLERSTDARTADVADLDALAEAARNADLQGARPTLAEGIRLLRRAGIVLSDRRAVKVQRLVAAAAVLDGRQNATGADVWPLVYAVPLGEQQTTAREVLRDLLEEAASQALPAAAAEATPGARARASHLASTGRQLLADPPAVESPEHSAWRLQLESLAREIDAGFSEGDRPADLDEVRRAVVAILGETGTAPEE